MKMEPSLSRIRGLGSAKEGAHQWRTQRLRGIALVPLVFWFVHAMISLNGADHATVTAWMHHHGNALMMVLLIGVMFPHAWQGMRGILEDYGHGEPARTILAIVLKFVMWLAGISSLMAVIRLYAGV